MLPRVKAHLRHPGGPTSNIEGSALAPERADYPVGTASSPGSAIAIAGPRS
jgi:hypothetical protein